jgi:acetyltransferase
MRILGPNSLGFLNVQDRIAAVASTSMEIPDLWPGSVSFVSQSGAMGFASIFSRGYDNGIGFRYVVSSGNEADLQASEVLRHFAADPETRVISALVEGLRDPEGFRRAAEEAAEAGKPMVVLKIGRTERGQRVASAHTAALAGSDEVHEAVFRAHGVVRVDDIDDLWEVPALFAGARLPEGRGVAVITSSGGLNGVLADQLGREGLELPELSARSHEELRSFLPPFVVVSNPVDLTAAFVGAPREAEVFSRTLEIIDADPKVDAILLVLIVVRREFDDVLGPIVETIRGCRKPVVLLNPGGNIAEAGLAALHRSGIPHFRTPFRCVRAVRHLCDYADFQRERKASGRPRWQPVRHSMEAQPFSPGMLGPDETRGLLKRFGLTVARQEIASGEEAALDAAARIGYPVALKALAPGLIHKTEAGGVALGLRSGEELVEAYREVKARTGSDRVLVQEMVESGVEMIVGLNRDPQFGPVVVVGMGGVLVEVLRDRVLGLPPLDRGQVLSMVRQLRGAQLLEGYRGAEAADVEALVETVVGVSRLAEEVGDRVESIDLNPVIVLPAGRGVRIVDARVIWHGEG